MTSTLDLPTAPTPVAAPPWYPLSTFAIGFGLAGLAGVWTRAGSALSLPRAVPQAFWAVAAVAWLWLLVAHAVRGARSGQSLAARLRHPAQGPLASLAPVTAMLLAADLFTWSPTAGRLLYFLALAASTLLAAWLLGSWLRGGLDVAALLLAAPVGGVVVPAEAGRVCRRRRRPRGLLACRLGGGLRPSRNESPGSNGGDGGMVCKMRGLRSPNF